MLAEKEDYHQRLNRQQLQSIKSLEQSLAGWDVRHAQREEFWINRYHQSTKLLFQNEKPLSFQPSLQSPSQATPTQVTPQQQENKTVFPVPKSGKRDRDREWDEKKKSYELLLDEKTKTINMLESKLECRKQGRHEDNDVQTSRLAMAA